MSNHIEPKPVVKPQSAPQNPETPIEPTVVNHEHFDHANGNENGGIYFQLNWDSEQAQHRQQQLLTIYAGYSGDNSGYNPDHNHSGNNFGQNPFGGYDGSSYSPNSNGFNGNHYGNSGNQYGYGDNPIVNLPFGHTGNSTNPDFSIYTGANVSSSSAENPNLLTLNDLLNLLDNKHNSSDYHNQPNDLWRDVRRFTETQIFQNDDGIEYENPSKYDLLLNEMQSKKIPLDDFIESLPPNEKQIFKARNQVDETFGAGVFQPDGFTLSEDGQLRVLEFAFENGQIQSLPENVQKDLREGKYIVSEDNGEIIVSRREVSVESNGDDAENILLFSENNPNRLISEKIEAGELKPRDNSAQLAIGNNNVSVLTDNGATRIVNHAVTDSSTSVSSVARRDGGTVLGGALISGSFTSIENFKNAENQGIGSSGTIENSNFGGRNSFAAGATGAMMSAAIGSLVPGSDAVISGVVGFISGVVIGVEADQGLRWLSGDRPTAIAASGNVNLLEENSFAPTFQTVLV